MITLILIISFGLIFGYFATQNTYSVVIHFLKYSTKPLPLYLIILISIGVGILITMVINFLRWFSTTRKLSRKEKDLRTSQNEIVELTKTVHKMEIENTKLEAELGKEDIDGDSI
jgi:uncharacterized integral membrane protein